MAGSSQPFTIGHFEKWAKRLVLDNGEFWQLEPFQRDFIEDVFGGFRECWAVWPEGNTKTTTIAGLGLYGIRFAEDANLPIAASTRDQARIMYRQAKGFITRSELGDDGCWFEAFDGYRRIDWRRPGATKRGETVGFMEIHAADSGSADGVIPYPYGFLDELHRHKSLDLYRTWLGKTRKRGAQIVTISTAGAPGGEFEVMREKIRGSGTLEQRSRTFARVEGPSLVMHEHAVPAAGDANDLELVAEANPFSGMTVQALSEKRASLTMSDAHWLRFTCNIAAETEAEPFIKPEDWAACCDADWEIPVGAEICIGADGSRTWDTTVIAWATAMADRVDVDCRVFSVREDAPHHVLHRGGKVDFGDVEEELLGLFDRFYPLQTAYDPRYLERSMEIVDRRLAGADVIPVEPTSKDARDAYQALFTAVIEGKLRHSGDPVIAAHLANCTVVRDDRTREIQRLRKIDPRKPIDAVPALALAVWRAAQAQPSVYEEREALAV